MEVKTYSVLFADDEFWTREKMRRIIPWDKYSLEFLEPAQDGEQVLERLKTEKVDILITDINMPYVNGVELLGKIQKNYPELITFVISGYDDFTYVKNSFMAGSINYLMKPIGKIDLVNALSKALEIIGERQNKKEELQKQQLEIQKASSFIKDREFSQLLDAKTASRIISSSISSQINYVTACVLLIKIHDMQEFAKIYHQDLNFLSISIKKRLEEIVHLNNVLIFNHVYRANEFLIVGEFSEACAGQLSANITKDFSSASKSPLTIIESTHSYSIETLSNAYVQNISCLMLRPFGKKCVIMKAEQMTEMQKEKIINRISELHLKEVRNFFGTGNVEALAELLFENIGLAYCQQQKWTYLEVRQTAHHFIDILVHEAKGSIHTQGMLDIQSMMEIMDKSIERMNLDELQEIMTEMIEYIITVNQPEAYDSIKGGIRQAVKYVNEHFQENLTLTSVADRFHIENCYFSRMFRKETGENFVLYICRKRMEKAVEYMKKSDINLTEIAFMVGYDDYTYFNKVFRKMMGISPREYRSQLKINSN